MELCLALGKRGALSTNLTTPGPWTQCPTRLGHPWGWAGHPLAEGFVCDLSEEAEHCCSL